uniref:Hda110 n=1 Tax=Arundo donax TaxID=35708 RepID=A0A0A9D7Y2_ARUDO
MAYSFFLPQVVPIFTDYLSFRWKGSHGTVNSNGELNSVPLQFTVWSFTELLIGVGNIFSKYINAFFGSWCGLLGDTRISSCSSVLEVTSFFLSQQLVCHPTEVNALLVLSKPWPSYVP